MPNLRRAGRAAKLSLFAALVGVALSAATPAHAEPTAEDKAAARAAAMQANAAFAAKRYAESLDLFTRAESLMHAPTHVLMIARAQAALGQLVRARESYLALVHETLPASASPAFKQAQVDGQGELAALEPRVPILTVKPDAANVPRLVVTMDGAALPPAVVGVAHPVDPGDRVFKARGVDLASDDTPVKITEGAHLEVVLKMKPAPGETGAADGAGVGASGDAAPDRSALRVPSYVLMGAGVAGVGVGVLFSVLGKSDRNKADQAYQACGGVHCPKGSEGANQTLKLDSSANTKETVGLIAIIGGGAGAVAGVTMFLLSRPRAAPAEGSIRPYLGFGSAGVAGTF
jgi:hypothetical protein